MIWSATALVACTPVLSATPTASLPPPVVVTEAPAPTAVPTPSRPSAAGVTATASPETETPTPESSAGPETPAGSAQPSPTYWTPVWPTNDLANFLRPPATFGGEPHLLFGRPLGEGGNNFAASDYRFGSTRSNTLTSHHGIDYGNPTGVPVVAIGDGTIYYAGPDAERQFGPRPNFFGNVVVLGLNGYGGAFALYGHLDTINVAAGQGVARGEVLGTVGAGGVAYGPHLHLEIRLDNPDNYYAVFNPELWLEPVSGFGVLVIRVTDADGRFLPGVRVITRCSDGAYRTADTYWYGGVNPDRTYFENAAIGDIPPGPCTVEAQINGQSVRTSVSVPSGGLGFAWLQP